MLHFCYISISFYHSYSMVIYMVIFNHFSFYHQYKQLTLIICISIKLVSNFLPNLKAINITRWHKLHHVSDVNTILWLQKSVISTIHMYKSLLVQFVLIYFVICYNTLLTDRYSQTNNCRNEDLMKKLSKDPLKCSSITEGSDEVQLEECKKSLKKKLLSTCPNSKLNLVRHTWNETL